jgi:hypothetical protein
MSASLRTEHPVKSVECPYCHQPAPLVSGLEVYPHRRDLWRRNFYKCSPCGAWVGCHPAAGAQGGGHGDGTVPMGRLANEELRAAKQAAHAAFDPMWMRTRESRGKARRKAYGWLALQLCIPVERCHIGEFDLEMCRKVVEVVERFNKEANHGQNRPSLRERDQRGGRAG